ncbi:elongation of very long chain fatty acids protein AAEL008004 isoform X2 [Solenopsis invicta]|uniref:elongation of very long chain fatty acids protein AAEL008004 isoform X2 n=1 Tax=Solenopsis invicta TaxID=13686 RepID=UPI00193C9A27|nr:elongation of very long chain fatty acids protein AAEL008004 isoform X2 [Solenopsis invicta]
MDILLNIHNSWKELDPRIIDLPLVASSYQVPLIIFAYLYFVLGCGPKFMKNRPPYKLKTFIQLYNIIQILANVWQIYDIIEAGIFVLRKKSNQVSGLHLYHHVSTLSLAWIGMRYYAVGQLLLVSITNNFVHVIMYIYYFLTTCGPTVQKPAAFIKQWITTVQMIQFVVLMMYLIHPLIVGCKVGTDHTNWFILVGIIDMAINLFNFRNFYQSSYKKSKKT